MIPSEYSTLLTNAPVGRHFARLHRDNVELADTVRMFVEAGLERGSGVVVIATESNTQLLRDRLAGAALDIEDCCRRGQLRLLNAEEVLSQIMREDTPDWVEFRRTVGSILESVEASGHSPIRAYGEMVNVLWRKGMHVAAVRLEEYWNELARAYPFSLFCGYLLDSHNVESYHGPLHEIGRTHSSIISTADDEAFRKALETASNDIFGVSLPQLMTCSGHEDHPGERRLPTAHRTMLWITRNIPTSSEAVLEKARSYYKRSNGAH